MNRTQFHQKPFFGPRDLLLNGVFCHVFAGVFLWQFAAMALLMSPPYQIGAVCGIAIFVWGWRSQKWLPSVSFLFFTVGFWLAVGLPWLGYDQRPNTLIP
jgi:hypothetical protein